MVEIDAAGRLVEQHEARPGHERHRGVEQLLLAVAQAAGLLVGEVLEPEEARSSGRPRADKPGVARAEQARRACVPWCSWPARIRFSRTVSCGKTCSSWKVRLTPSRLRSQGRMPVTARPSRRTSPRARLQLAEDAVEQRRLAAAVRADDAEDLAFVDVERHAVDGDDAAEALLQVAHLEHGAHRAPLRPCAARGVGRGLAPRRPARQAVGEAEQARRTEHHQDHHQRRA